VDEWAPGSSNSTSTLGVALEVWFCAGHCLRERRIEMKERIKMKQKGFSSELVQKIVQAADAGCGEVENYLQRHPPESGTRVHGTRTAGIVSRELKALGFEVKMGSVRQGLQAYWKMATAR
jgi:hypothetical protein